MVCHQVPPHATWKAGGRPCMWVGGDYIRIHVDYINIPIDYTRMATRKKQLVPLGQENGQGGRPGRKGRDRVGCIKTTVQGYLAHKKHPPCRTLQEDHT